MPILDKIEIPASGPIKTNLVIEFSSPFCVLIGKNSSGKSTVIWNIYNKRRDLNCDIYIVRTSRGLKDQVTRKSEIKIDDNLADFEKLLLYATEDTLKEISITVSKLIDHKINIKRESSDKKLVIEVNGEKVAKENLSSGLQSILTIEAILRYPKEKEQRRKISKKDNGIVFLIEEIENFLHPNLIRTYISKLKDIAFKNSNSMQIIITSHSNLVVSMVEPNEIIRIEKDNVYYIKDKLTEKHRSMWHYLIDQNKSDFFFSNKVIFVEGYTDKLVLLPILERLNINAYNISLISIDGVYNRDFMQKLSNSFGIPSLLIRDCDQGSQTEPGKIHVKENFIEVVLPYVIKSFNSESIQYNYVEIEDIIPLRDWAYVISMVFPNKTFEFLSKLLEFDYFTCNSYNKKKFSSIIKEMKYHLRLYSELYKNHGCIGDKNHSLNYLIEIIKTFIYNDLDKFPKRSFEPSTVLNKIDELKKYFCFIVDNKVLFNKDYNTKDISYKEESYHIFFYDCENMEKDLIKKIIEKLCYHKIRFFFLCEEKHFDFLYNVLSELKSSTELDLKINSQNDYIEILSLNKNTNKFKDEDINELICNSGEFKSLIIKYKIGSCNIDTEIKKLIDHYKKIEKKKPKLKIIKKNIS